MKFAFSTLTQFIETQASFNEICETLTKIGFEVENIHDKSKELAYFTVAKIIDTKPHENSSKLQICFVETIDNPNPIQIVCGAKNARKGIKVAYAPIDSVIPSNQMVIKKAKIAGIESNGMLCSASELNLGTDSDGIIEIPDQYPIGAKISKIFNQDDVIIELNITPNRGDCLGVYNIANELVATNIATFKKFDFFPPKSSINFDFKITNNDIINCKYISFIDKDDQLNFDVEMKKIQSEFKKIIKEEKKSQEELAKAFNDLGYEL
jgi:phenylalanyl-tRNA synthetase beta chain